MCAAEQIYSGNWAGIIPLPTQPASGGTGTQLTGWGYLIVALFKLFAIAWSVAFQFRGGVIFPLINVGKVNKSGSCGRDSGRDVLGASEEGHQRVGGTREDART